MISKLHFKASSSVGQSPLVIDTSPSVTIFVGPNNSGKSQALRNIASHCNTGQFGSHAQIIEKLTFIDNATDNLEPDLHAIKTTINQGEVVPPGHSMVRLGNQRFVMNDRAYIQARTAPNNNPHHFATWYLSTKTLNIDGPGRIQLVNPNARGDLRYPDNPLAKIFTNDEKRRKLRNTIHESVGLYFSLDASIGDQLHVRFGLISPPNERSLGDETLDYMRTAKGIQSVSDGVKAYTGILLQIHAGDPKVIIIDEPEAFLHPSLARNLGKEIAKGAVEEGKHIFVSTHSPDFLMGAISSGARVNIVRLTYDQNIGTARLLPSGELTRLMQDPLLRSVGVLSGLFYHYVLVGEGGADRAFYQEINERLLAIGDSRGIPHALFLNAENKHTIPRIIDPLRKLGIPAAGIVDIDVLKDGGEEWTRYLKASNIPTSEHQPYGTKRASVLNTLKNANPDYKIKGGMEVLPETEKEAANNLCDELERYGLFIVRRGEVEAWLSSLDIPRSKHTWLRTIFEKMGSEPSDENYVRPTTGDVWDFVGSIKKWLIAPEKRGIPN